jgi:Tfp pilus assembly PilM family ATPase
MQQKQQQKHANSWKLNNAMLNNQWVIDEIKEEIENFLEVNENENMTYLNLLGHSKCSSKRKVYSHGCIH